MSRYLDLAWLVLRLSFVFTLLIIFLTGLVLLVSGSILGRRAIAGILVLPPFMMFYLLRFQEIRRTVWSVLAHMGTIVCVGFIVLLATKVISVQAPGMLIALCISVLGIAACVTMIAYAAGWGIDSFKV